VYQDAGVGPTWTDLGNHAVDRVASLTVMNTTVAVSTFTKPWTMRPFELPVLGSLWLKGTIDPMFVKMMYDETIADPSATPREDVLAYRRLLLREDGGRAFLRIMRSFETTVEKEALYRGVVGSDRYPVQAVWGEYDAAVRVDKYGLPVRELVGEQNFHRVPGKHFLQEDCHEAIADHVAGIASRAG